MRLVMCRPCTKGGVVMRVYKNRTGGALFPLLVKLEQVNNSFQRSSLKKQTDFGSSIDELM